MKMHPLIENIRRLRKQKGWSQTNMAEDLGLDYSTYGKIERGKISINIARLEQISKILQVSIQELYGWEDSEEIKHLRAQLINKEKEILSLETRLQLISPINSR